ncbi:chemotaxis protein CheW [Lentisalinibacter orientalis]|uniref:chemotaxis protein CheW n=1 Tax=Lentisalinibacter orientalis TaxID=2992241 RepID=UPI003867D1BE
MSAVVEELYSLLVPLAEDRLIVPRACVAEVVRYSPPEARAGEAEPWVLGGFNWNGRLLPLVSFEGALGKPVPQASGRTRIVVFHGVTGRLRAGHFGMLTQGFPQLVRVNREVLRPGEPADEWPEGAPVFCRVKMINEYPLIPDLARLEEILAEQELEL